MKGPIAEAGRGVLLPAKTEVPPDAPAVLRTIHARAPLRINDIGGWTDTWFAGWGRVLNIAVAPAVEVRVRLFGNPRRRKKRVTVRAENFSETFLMDPDAPRRTPHELLQFTIASLPVPPDAALDIRLLSPVPAGIATGTSAAVCVALLGALDRLGGGARTWFDIAGLAHRVETEKLRLQSGIQDQICAAHGGISFIEMDEYPNARVRGVRVNREIWSSLDRRLSLVYLGRPHTSSELHEQVIARLEAGGPQMLIIRDLARIAVEAKSALEDGDLEAYGESMVRNNEGQRALHAGLISGAADAIASAARRHGAAGWKVNGAGGEGGSMTVLGPSDDAKRRRMIDKISGLGGDIRVIPVSLSPAGLKTWED
jgi:D-glycero-alpha-D-manno-heptose-7-phosphate kinase